MRGRSLPLPDAAHVGIHASSSEAHRCAGRIVALKATVHRLELEVADIERGYYATHALTLARHPSETAERLLLRVLAFALHAHPELEFGRGLSTGEDPDLWLRDATGSVRLWIELGLPEERRLRRAAGRAQELVVIAYGGRSGVDLWWERNRAALARLERLRVLAIAPEELRELAGFLDRGMRLQCTVQDGQVCISGAERALIIEPVVLRAH